MLPGIKLFDLTNKTAIVTGGSKGLGLAMAEGLASAGANLVIISRNQKEAQAAAEKIIAEYKTKAIAISATVTSEEEIQKAVATTIKEFGSIDILINNAGINIRGPIDELSYEDFKKVQQTNVDGTWLPSKAVVPQMKKQKSGRIINLASTLGVVGLANRTPYATSKGAVVLMTRALALELAPFNITVNAICPGPFLTDMNIPIKDDENTKKFIIGAVALERWGELKEIQGAALYLASAASSYTTGSLITVDGGWTAR
ncbi:MAG: glucose 1-dehydrogenase [Gemmataceae bacterium]|jgi:NAD(P)-dependent dehydrogenase (short-subunit alcohol dehydrogenase family)|nr:glucose 1-dehydrogenase [Gemmataceae bacterium]MBJ7432662.1 glucose 1-dehydrogenase [Gemmataceae bacterium]MBJ7494867.1 glucose 1-dehydrogenase [Gemmataceae bacterium]MCY2972012.1 glucose 1-dehydrogenase [Planctomycetota bacterium]